MPPPGRMPAMRPSRASPDMVAETDKRQRNSWDKPFARINVVDIDLVQRVRKRGCSVVSSSHSTLYMHNDGRYPPDSPFAMFSCHNFEDSLLAASS